jgi:hypothetical protein
MEETIRQLLAKQRSELEEEMKRRGESLAAAAPKAAPIPVAAPAPPAPIAAAAMPPKPQTPKPVEAALATQSPQVAAAAPTAVAAPAAGNSLLPMIGDQWRYAYVDTYGRNRREARIEVLGVSAEGILEDMSFGAAAHVTRVYGVDPIVSFAGFWEFSPYLLAFGTPPDSWSSLPYSGYARCSQAGAVCRFHGKVAGTETITTRAGKFEATKIIIDLDGRHQDGRAINPLWRQLTFWYSAAAKRVVRSTVRTFTGAVAEDDYDLELVSFKVNSTPGLLQAQGAAADEIRRLLDRQRAELEEEMRRRGETPAPPIQVAAVAPTALASAGDSRLPKVGDAWTYDYVDSFGRRHRRMRFAVTGVSPEGILESGGFADGDRETTRAYTAGPSLVFDGFFEFSPYLATSDIPGDTTWPALVALRYQICQRAGATCRFEGKVAGREKVTTPAGAFDALKVVITFNGQGIAPFGTTSTYTWRELTYWYSESAKRVVKSNVHTRNGFSLDDDYTIELVSYKLN